MSDQHIGHSHNHTYGMAKNLCGVINASIRAWLTLIRLEQVCSAGLLPYSLPHE